MKAMAMLTTQGRLDGDITSCSIDLIMVMIILLLAADFDLIVGMVLGFELLDRAQASHLAVDQDATCTCRRSETETAAQWSQPT
jgi:hypothetical protein